MTSKIDSSLLQSLKDQPRKIEFANDQFLKKFQHTIQNCQTNEPTNQTQDSQIVKKPFYRSFLNRLKKLRSKFNKEERNKLKSPVSL